LVNKLDPKNLNIGRPSTYGAIITTIQERGYVTMGNVDGKEKDSLIITWNGSSKLSESKNKIVIGKENNKLIPTNLGIIVTEFLMKYFSDIVDYKFTASMEDSLDKIAEGAKKWTTVLDGFYKNFHPTVEKLLESKSTVKSDMTIVLGTHPELGHEISATIARFGPVIKMATSKSKAIYAPIKEPLTRDTITLEQALKLLEYPKDLGKYEGLHVTVNKGKFGLYLKWGDVKAPLENLPEEIKIKDRENVALEEAITVLKNKRKNVIWEHLEGKVRYSILDGQYGKYINVVDTAKKIKTKPLRVTVKSLTDEEIKKLTFDKVQELIKLGFESKANRYKKKDKSVKEVADKKVKEVLPKTENKEKVADKKVKEVLPKTDIKVTVADKKVKITGKKK
jgi:DNA topoisomerase-1